ncbi:MAG: SRPBCC domain-containing protein [Actinomycetota bacterium]
MTVTSIERDDAAAQLRVRSGFAATVERLWEVWSDPRQLERWWGPSTHPATVVEHDLAAGGRVTYYLTGPDGTRYHGWWRIVSVEAPTALEFEDGPADDDGVPIESAAPTRSAVRIEAAEPGTVAMTLTTTFPTPEVLGEALAAGAADGMARALDQIDGVLG